MNKYILELELRYRKMVGDDDRYTTPQIVFVTNAINEYNQYLQWRQNNL